MTVLPFILVAAASGTGALLLRGRQAWSTAVAILGLVAMVVTAASMSASAAVSIGGATLAGSEWLRLFALLGSAVGVLLVVIDLTARHEPDVPGTIVLGLGAAVLALALPDPGLAVVAATAGGLAGVLIAAPAGAAARAAWVGVRELRALALAGALAIVAVAWLARPLDDLVAVPEVFGLAYLAFALAVAIRFGAIPFHRWAARVADAAPGAALPLLMAWAPAAFAAVALVWIDQSVAPLALPLANERGLVALIGAASVILGLVAALVQDDLEHVVGYTIASDAGFIVLGLAAFDPDVWAPSRTWLLIFVVGRTALAAWAVAIHGAFGTRRLPELSGWVRRTPVLAVGLGIIAVATIAWPGVGAWEARAAIAGLVLPGPVAALVTIAPLLSIVIVARIIQIGLRPIGPVARDGRSERPGWPVAWPQHPIGALVKLERVAERGSHAVGGALDVVWALPAAARHNRVPIASIAVLFLATLSFVVANGGLGVPAAARAVPVISERGPGPGPLVSPSAGPDGEPSASPGITFTPIDGGGSSSPDVSPAPAASLWPSPG